MAMLNNQMVTILKNNWGFNHRSEKHVGTMASPSFLGCEQIPIWLVVLTILKNISQWEGLSHKLWNIKNVPNHQPAMFSTPMLVYRREKKNTLFGGAGLGPVPVLGHPGMTCHKKWSHEESIVFRSLLGRISLLALTSTKLLSSYFKSIWGPAKCRNHGSSMLFIRLIE